MKSPLSDKMFGLSLQKVQEEVSKAPESVSVNVRLNELYLHPLGPEEWHQWQKDNVLPKQIPVTNYEVNSPTLTK
jgi:hypothetical protein